MTAQLREQLPVGEEAIDKVIESWSGDKTEKGSRQMHSISLESQPQLLRALKQWDPHNKVFSSCRCIKIPHAQI